MSVGAVAGANVERFRMLKTLNAFALRLSTVPSRIGRLMFFSSDMSTEVYPGPVRILRARAPGPLVVTSKLVVGLGNTPLIHCCFEGSEIIPPKYANGASGQ